MKNHPLPPLKKKDSVLLYQICCKNMSYYSQRSKMHHRSNDQALLLFCFTVLTLPKTEQ